MKKAAGIILKVLLGLILLILILLFTVPVIFKDKIRIKVEQVINESVNAQVKFDDYKLGFFKNFPNLAFSLKGVSVVGVDKFEGDTLAGFRSFDLVFNLGSLLGKSGYEVKSIILDRPVINAIVLKDGSANWDIAKDTTAAETETVEEEEGETTPSELKILLKKFAIQNASVSYVDEMSDMSAYLKNLNFNLAGDMTASETDLDMSLNIGEVDFLMEGIRYLKSAVIDSRIGIRADLDNYTFTLAENYFALNDLRLNFSGMISMPEDDIETDLSLSTDQTSFKTLLSLVPAVYMNDFEGLSASGEFSLKGLLKGVYSDADSTLPDVNLSLSIRDGLISYPALPEKISDININTVVDVNGRNLDLTTVNIDLFHFSLAGNPFDMIFSLKTPMSDPDFKGSLTGKIDLDALSKAVPLDSITLSGIIEMAVKMGGKLSMIEKEQYDKFEATGTMNIQNMLVAMTGYPEVRIDKVGFEFSPAYAAMTEGNIKVGDKSDFNLTGRIENYIPFVFNNETIRGNMTLTSNLVDASDILSKIATDTTDVVEDDTSSLTLIRVPQNIDFTFNARINNFSYDNIKAKDVKGNIIVKDGILSIRETGMNILGGLIIVNADYDTRDSLKPIVKTDLKMQSIGIKDAFTTFNTVQKLAPAASGIEGKMNLNLAFESLLGNDMMPVIQSIVGGGKLQSNEVTLLESKAYETMKGVLKLSDKYSNTFRDINASFKIHDGRVYVSPFNTKVGNIKMNISGDQGLDQTLNYLVKTEIPRSDLGNSVNALIDNLSSQAAAFGITYKPADILKVNVKITGVFGKPVVMPDFGGSSGDSSSGGIREVAKETVKETVNQVVDSGKEKARQEAESRGNQLITEAETQAQRIREEAASAAEKLRQEAEIQAQRLIDAASSKGAIAKMAAEKSATAIRNEADKKANALVQEADIKATKLVDEAKAKKEELINKI